MKGRNCNHEIPDEDIKAPRFRCLPPPKKREGGQRWQADIKEENAALAGK